MNKYKHDVVIQYNLKGMNKYKRDVVIQYNLKGINKYKCDVVIQYAILFSILLLSAGETDKS